MVLLLCIDLVRISSSTCLKSFPWSHFPFSEEAATPSTCPSTVACFWQDKYLITRLWSLTDVGKNVGFTTQDVADKFQQGFAQEVVAIPGFKAYVGAPDLNDEDLTFFFNVFDDADSGLAAQEAAVEFVDSSAALSVNIEPAVFATGDIAYQVKCTYGLFFSMPPKRCL